MAEDKIKQDIINYLKYGRLTALVKILRERNIISDEEVNKILSAE